MNDSEFDDEDLKLLNQARLETDAQDNKDLPTDNEGDETTADPQAANTASAQAEVIEAPAAKVETQEVDQSAQQEQRPTGDVRAALRASRRSEERARRDNERLREENEALRANQVTKPSGLVDPELLEGLETDFPQVAGVVKTLVQKVEDLSKGQTAQQAATPDEPDFIPDRQHPDVQAAIDEVPDLLDWQINPDQTNFQLAVQTDILLRASPKWKAVPQADRLAEVVRRVKEETAAPAPASSQTTQTKAATAADAAAVIAAAATTTPVGIGDLRGSATPSKTEPDFSRMSDEQIFASLPR